MSRSGVFIAVLLMCVLLLSASGILTAQNNSRAERLYEQGKSAYLARDYEKAAQLLREAVGLKADSGESWFLLGQVYYEWGGRLEQAQQAFNRAEELLPAGSPSFVAARLRLADLAKPEPEPAPEQQVAPPPPVEPPPPPPEPTVQDQLNAAWKNDDWAGIIYFGERLLSRGETEPEYAPTHYYLGVAHLRSRSPITGRDYLSDYLLLQPEGEFAAAATQLLEEGQRDHIFTLVDQIERALDHGDVVKAKGLIEEAKREKMPSADLVFLEGLTYMMDDQEGRALDRFQEYLDIAPAGSFVGNCERWKLQLQRPRMLVVKDDLLYRMYGEGTAPRLISRDEQGVVEQATVAPGGRYVAYVTWSDARNRRTVFVSDVFGGTPVGIFQSEGFASRVKSLQWYQHEGVRYVTFVGEDPQSKMYSIFIYEQGRSREAFSVPDSRTRPARADSLNCRWSPDAEYLAWTGNEDDLWACRLAQTSNAVQLESRFKVQAMAWGPRVGPGNPGFLVWSDGTNLYKRDADIEFLNVKRPQDRYWDTRFRQVSKVEVSSDGTVIAAWEKPSGRLLLVPSSREIGFRPMSFEGVQEFSFSKVGRQLAYRAGEGVYITNLVEGIDPTYVEGTRGDTLFEWSPSTLDLLVWQEDCVRLTVDGAYRAGRSVAERGPFIAPRWSPDATRVAIQKNVAGDDGLGAIWILDRSAPTSRSLYEALRGGDGPFHLVGWASVLGPA